MSDRVVIQGARCEAFIGVGEEERSSAQILEIDVELTVPSRRRVEMADAVDYREVLRIVRECCAAKPRVLLEHAAEDIALALREHCPADTVTIRIRKPAIAERYGVESIGVEVTR